MKMNNEIDYLTTKRQECCADILNYYNQIKVFVTLQDIGNFYLLKKTEMSNFCLKKEVYVESSSRRMLLALSILL